MKPPFETKWVGDLLSRYPDQVKGYLIDDPNNLSSPYISETPFLLIANHAVNYRQMINRVKEKYPTTKYGILLLSDENIAEPCEWLHDPNCTMCIRNYVHPLYLGHKKVYTVGLGYNNNFTNSSAGEGWNTKRIDERKYIWSFSGTPHGDRGHMLDVFESIPNNYTRRTKSFDSEDGLRCEKYPQLMGDTQFALVPPGQDSMDSFRMYEALEAGCIPVALHRTKQLPLNPSYWHYIFRGEKEMPFIVADTWEEAYDKVADMILNQDTEKVRCEIQKFWMRHKEEWRSEIKRRLIELAGA